MSNREVMQQALEALTIYSDAQCSLKGLNAITALRTALEQPEQEPSQWRDMVVATLVREGINKHKARELADHFAAQPEPVACRFCFNEKGCWAWQCYSCGEIDDVQKPTPPSAIHTSPANTHHEYTPAEPDEVQQAMQDLLTTGTGVLLGAG